jgi:hypothetical protein
MIFFNAIAMSTRNALNHFRLTFDLTSSSAVLLHGEDTSILNAAASGEFGDASNVIVHI